jgi:general secretion pathway protein C
MAVDQLLRRNFWAVIMLLVAMAAFLNAQAFTQLVGIGVSPDEKLLAQGPGTSRGAPAPTQNTSRATSAEPILSRNPFDHVTGPLRPVATAETVGAATEIDTSDVMNVPQCDGMKVLIIIHAPDPDWSFAAMTGGGETKSVLRRRGTELGGKKIRHVGWDRVWMEQGSSLCQAMLFKPADMPQPKADAPAPVASAPPATGKGAPPVDPSISKGIVKISANEFNVDRGVVDKILENQADLMRQARIVPEQENGKVVGIRLFGVRSDTLLGVLGMENGDRLQTINGFEVASPEKALEAYARLRTADKLTIQLNRRGQNMNLDFNIK